MPSRRNGFSLVLSLAVMALLVLVVLSLSGLLAVESRVAAAGQAGRQARLNALAAGRLALGQLQLLAGNDQRVTARADLFERDAGGASRNTYFRPINSGNKTVDPDRRWWTGVWMTGTGGTALRAWDPAKPDARICLGWLVSPSPGGAALQATPSSALTASASETIGLAAAVLDDGAEEGGVPLLGASDLGPNGVASDQVRRPGFPLPEGGGSVAWWTSDEGVKARVNLVDPLLEPAAGAPVNFPAINAWWKGFRLVAFGQSGADKADAAGARLPGLQEARDADLRAAAARSPAQGAEDTDLARTRRRGDLQAWLATRAEPASAITRATAENGASSGWHHLTTLSRGVMSNTLDGGLRLDLSVAFELPHLTAGGVTGWKDLTDATNPTRLFALSRDANNLNLAASTGVNATAEPDSAEWNHADRLRYLFEVPIPEEESGGRSVAPHTIPGPTWDLLRAHYRLYKRETEALSVPGQPFVPGADAWLARGSAPYTFTAGSPTQAISAPHPGGTPGLPTSPPAQYGPKANLAALQPLTATATAAPRHRRVITLENGTSATRVRDLRPRLAPQVTRIGMIHSLIYCANTLAIGLDPFLAIHNPYDVPLEFMGIGVTWAQFNSTRFNIYRSDQPPSLGFAPVATCTLGNDLYQRSYTFRGFHTYAPGAAPLGQWRVAPQALLRLEPGETRILTPNLAGNRWQVYRAQSYQNMSMGAFAYDLQSNFRINAHRVPDMAELRENATMLDALVAPAPGAPYASEPLMAELKLTDVGQVNAFDVHLYRGNRHGTSSSAPGWWSWLGQGMPAEGDNSDEHLLHRVGFRANTLAMTGGSDGAILSQAFVRSPAVDGTRNLPDKRFFAYTEMRLRSLRETNGFPAPVLAFNPRGQLADPRSWDGLATTSPAWTANIEPLSGDPLTLLQFWPGNVPEKNQASWGESHLPGQGTRSAVLFQVPRRPLVSIAQLTHADIGELDLDPAYAIGNSFAHPGLFTLSPNKAEALDKVVSWPMPEPGAFGSPLERVDLSYAANLALWDKTFFSGLNAGGANANTDSGSTNATQPHATLTVAANALVAGQAGATANRRFRFWNSRTDEANRVAGLLNPATTARQLLIEGAFNVNSTSVEAWKAQLAGGFGALAEGFGTSKPAVSPVLANRPDHPFSRLHPPPGEFAPAGDASANRWRTYRSLADGDPALDRLAEAIVAEVRARGPFMSLADFVNRRLKSGDSDPTNARKGALQAAIDAVPDLNADAVGVAAIGATALARLPQAAALAPAGVPEQAPLALGRPDMILQSDVLAAIGPHLAARSDTFVIRAQGEFKGANAWCEITVQRTPEWIKPQAAEATAPDDALSDHYQDRVDRSKRGEVATMVKRNLRSASNPNGLDPVNAALGRRFVIVDFRWIPAP